MANSLRAACVLTTSACIWFWACAEGSARYDPKTSASLRDAGAAGGGAASVADGAVQPTSTSTADTGFGVRFVGRVDDSDARGARFAWSGAGVVARFTGTALGAQFSSGQQYTVVVDGEVKDKFIPSGGMDTIATGLPSGEHTVEIYRRTEASQGESTFMGLMPTGGGLLAPPSAPERRIEVVGDSISCGYGNEGADMNCGFTPDTENHYLTYGAIAARELGAELSTVAWSGKGVVCNYGDGAQSCIDPMPTYYDRILPDSATSVWDFSEWQAHAVVVNLGTNDFSTSEDPTQADFEAAYAALLGRIRNAYPQALIVAAVGPMLTGSDLSSARTYIANAVQRLAEDGDTRVKTLEFAPQESANGYGCDWHPSLRTHELMAATLTQKLRDELGW